ncbi:MAG: M23 family metallopeptidase [Candidatus Omnitrophica bacterium]|nr:M23 family metallopeptidase [Candidatus Omnitrophota bacterium]
MVKRNIIIAAILALVILLPFLIFRIKDKEISFRSKNQVIEGYISEGDMLGDVLLARNIPAQQVNLIINELKKVFNVRKCRIGDRWEMHLTDEGEFIKFVYYDGPIDFYEVKFNSGDNTYLACAKAIEAEKMIRGVRGEIRSSLYESMSYVNINPEIIIQFAEIFSSKVDFFTDCRTGDKFNILWETYFDKKGNPLKDVMISAASYASMDKNNYYAFYFETPEGKGGYYDENGKSVESAFLRAPLSYRRISSHFTHRRLHPIYKVYRPHLGIDYAAPSGTPVSSIGNGTVAFAGWNGGLGKTVKVKHPNGYVSWYGHLSRIGKGIKKGAKVKKGQVVGAVGSTGVSTGPHLDFRLQINGKFVNYLAIKLPPSFPLPEQYLPQFKETAGMFTARMDSLKDDKEVVFPSPEVKEKSKH